jgi:uncharacterized membrane protein
MSFVVNAACAENSDKTATNFSSLECVGTEPFWSLDLKGSVVIFEDLDSVHGEFELSKVITSSNHTNRWLLLARNSESSNMSIALNKTDQCSDDMSDFSYEYEVMIVTPEEKLFSGCCNRIRSIPK